MDNEAFFKQAFESEKSGHVDLAATLYQRILDNLPTHPATLYNLAVLNAKRNDYTRAVDLFERLIQVTPNASQAYYNAAICYIKKGNIDHAISYLIKAVEYEPSYAAAQHMLGSILLRRNEFEKALLHLTVAVQYLPDDANAHCHMGMACMHTEHIDEALLHLEKAIALDSSLAEAHYHSGVIALRRGKLEDADQHFQSTVGRDSSHFSAYYNLALIKKNQSQLNLAKYYIEKAYQLSDNNPFIAYLHAILNGNTAFDHTPDEFVTNLFDHYASYYDEHLKNVLHCGLPQQCVALFNDHIKNIKNQWDCILDLGCGTGLTGEAFRSYATQLMGSDLSENMLSKAREKNIYDHLYHENMIETLKRFDHTIEIAICCDTLVYVGKLEPFFDNLSHALRPNGYAILTFESSDTESTTLSSTGRFTHSASYIRSCAIQYEFNMIEMRETGLRNQAGEQVPGYIVLIQYLPIKLTTDK